MNRIRRKIATAAILTMLTALAYLSSPACSSDEDDAKPFATVFPVPTLSLPTTFEGFESAEQVLGWRPLRPASGFALDDVLGRVSAGLFGHYIELYYVDQESDTKLTFIQGYDSELPGKELTKVDDPADSVETVGRFSARVWFADGARDAAVFIFRTDVKHEGAPVFGTVLAQDIEDGRFFIESLE